MCTVVSVVSELNSYCFADLKAKVKYGNYLEKKIGSRHNRQWTSMLYPPLTLNYLFIHFPQPILPLYSSLVENPLPSKEVVVRPSVLYLAEKYGSIVAIYWVGDSLSFFSPSPSSFFSVVQGDCFVASGRGHLMGDLMGRR